MNLLNRLVIVLELLLAMAFSGVLFFFVMVNRKFLRDTLGPTLARIAQDQTDLAQFVCLGILVLVFAFSLLYLLLQFARPESARMRVESVQGAEVSITADAIVQRLEYEIDSLSDVIKVRPRVSTSGRNKPVDVTMDLLISPEADIATKTQEAMGVARRVLEDRLGLKVGKIQVHLDHAKLQRPPLPKKTG